MVLVQVLGHCIWSKSRSTATATQFLMAKWCSVLRQVMRAVTTVRPGMAINVGFKRKLQQRKVELHPKKKPSVQFKASRKGHIAGIIEKRWAQEAAAAAEVAGFPTLATASPLCLSMVELLAVDLMRQEAKRRSLADKGSTR